MWRWAGGLVLCACACRPAPAPPEQAPGAEGVTPETSEAGRSGSYDEYALEPDAAALAWPADGPPAPPEALQLDPAVRDLIAEARQRCAENPRADDLVGRLGMIYEANNLAGLARQCYLRAHALQPAEPRWSYHLALLDVHEGRLETAEVRLRRVLSLTEWVPARYRLGKLLLETGRLEEAREQFEKVREALPHQPAGYYGLGLVHRAQGDLESAERAFQEALRRLPSSPFVHQALGNVYRRMGRAEEAQRHLARAAQHGPFATLAEITDPWADEILTRYRVSLMDRIFLCEDLLGLRQPSVALPILQELAQRYPENGRVWNLMGEAYMQLEQFGEAVRCYREALERDPDNAGFAADVAWGYLVLERTGEAARYVDRALAIRQDHAKALFTKGAVLLAQGRPEEAARWVRQALAVNANLEGAYRLLGDIEYRRGAVAEAIAAYREAVARDPNDWRTWAALARALFVADRLGEADEAYGKVLDLRPDYEPAKRARAVIARRQQ